MIFKKRPNPKTVERVKEFAHEQNLTEQKMEPYPIKIVKETEEEKWEQRRWELVRYLVAQDRRSVILGKLRASAKTIASKARELADATILELRTNKPGYGKE